MENQGYTHFLTYEADDLEMKLYDEDISSDYLVNYLVSAFRPFSVAIVDFLYNHANFSCNYNDEDELKNLLYSKYTDIGYSINPANIRNWLKGTAPAYTADGRDKMYALCFALEFDLGTTKEFFRKVYFDRCFDCHNIDEAIYYYCFKNSLSYSHAKKLIDNASSMIDFTIDDETETILYTQAIQQSIDIIHSDDEMLNYIKKNADSFKHRRISAKKIFYDLLDDIQGTREDAKLISENPNVVNDFSSNRPIKALTVLEYFKYTTEDNPLLQIYSDEFMINQILDNRQHEKNIRKDISLPAALKASFPNKHVINDLKQGFSGKKNFKNDALRKTIILMYFYKYWCEQDLKINLNPSLLHLQYSTFIEGINDCIVTCGFEPLYIGNPYDWIFIFSSKCDKPLDTFRSIYSSLVNTSDE